MQETDGRAFLVRSINNQFVGISQLDDSYTNTTGLVSVAPRVTPLPMPEELSSQNHVAHVALRKQSCCFVSAFAPADRCPGIHANTVAVLLLHMYELL